MSWKKKHITCDHVQSWSTHQRSSSWFTEPKSLSVVSTNSLRLSFISHFPKAGLPPSQPDNKAIRNNRYWYTPELHLFLDPLSALARQKARHVTIKTPPKDKKCQKLFLKEEMPFEEKKKIFSRVAIIPFQLMKCASGWKGGKKTRKINMEY